MIHPRSSVNISWSIHRLLNEFKLISPFLYILWCGQKQRGDTISQTSSILDEVALRAWHQQTIKCFLILYDCLTMPWEGLRVVLQERGINTHGMNVDQMREILGNHPDFKNEKSWHIVYFLPKYHCELNPIERVWTRSKRYTKAYCNYDIHSLRKNIIPTLESVPLESIQKHFKKVRHYMFAYLAGVSRGAELENLAKRYKSAVKSHWRISDKHWPMLYSSQLYS